MKDILFRKIGVIHTPFSQAEGTPIQSARSKAVGSVVIAPEYADGLEGIEGFSHLILVYCFHLAESSTSLKVKPFLDDQTHGIFATRFPIRPNPLGLSVVQLTMRTGNILKVTGVDMLDGSPLLDIKPYVPEFDIFSAEHVGWYENRKFR